MQPRHAAEAHPPVMLFDRRGGAKEETPRWQRQGAGCRRAWQQLPLCIAEVIHKRCRYGDPSRMSCVRPEAACPEVLAGSTVTCPGCGADVGVPLPKGSPKRGPASAVRATARPRDSGAIGELEHAPRELEHASPGTRLGVVALGLGLLSIAVLSLPFIGYSLCRCAFSRNSGTSRSCQQS
jgi:hypothetical protein